jgi:uncharacterized protein (TIGR02996 family)
MTEREALLRAVCEQPDDDTPRLVFADWLQENGEEARAEFIRVQSEAARLATDDDRLDGVIRRDVELQQLYGSRWLAELPVPDPEHIDWVKYPGGWLGGEPFDRGFACRLWVKTAGTLVACAGELFTATPVRRLMVHHIMRADKLARLPQLRHLHTLRVRILSRQAAVELADCPHLDPVPDIRLPLRSLPEEYTDLLRKRFGDRLEHQP